MKKILIGFTLASVLVIGTALSHYNQGIDIGDGYGGEPGLQIANRAQTADWIYCKSNGVAVFEVPSSGVIGTKYGGTGTNGSYTVPVYVIFTGTNGLTYTNRIINGIIQ